jgi:uncharacterized membrane-anchored protein
MGATNYRVQTAVYVCHWGDLKVQIRPLGVKTGQYLSERVTPKGRTQGKQTSAIVALLCVLRLAQKVLNGLSFPPSWGRFFA